MKDKVTVIIPTYNEERNIREVIKGVKPYADEILIVDAKKSRDRTAEIAKSLGARVIKDNGKGVGAAKRIGIKSAKNEIIVLFDADGSHDPKDIPKMVDYLISNGHDFVVGSRMTGGSDELHGTFSNFARNVG